MPIYEYQASSEKHCPHCKDRFEVVQSMTAAQLKKCPECGAAVQRVFSATAIHGAGSTGDVLSNKNLAAKGFTKYQKSRKGGYEKILGDGPDIGKVT